MSFSTSLKCRTGGMLRVLALLFSSTMPVGIAVGGPLRESNIEAMGTNAVSIELKANGEVAIDSDTSGLDVDMAGDYYYDEYDGEEELGAEENAGYAYGYDYDYYSGEQELGAEENDDYAYESYGYDYAYSEDGLGAEVSELGEQGPVPVCSPPFCVPEAKPSSKFDGSRRLQANGGAISSAVAGGDKYCGAGEPPELTVDGKRQEYWQGDQTGVFKSWSTKNGCESTMCSQGKMGNSSEWWPKADMWPGAPCMKMTCEMTKKMAALYNLGGTGADSGDLSFNTTGTWDSNTYTSKGTFTSTMANTTNSGEWIMKGWFYCDPKPEDCSMTFDKHGTIHMPTKMGQWKIANWQKSELGGKCWHKIDFDDNKAWQFFAGALQQGTSLSITKAEESGGTS